MSCFAVFACLNLCVLVLPALMATNARGDLARSGDVFAHQSVIKADGFRSLALNESVEFETETGMPSVAAAQFFALTLETDNLGRVRATIVTGPGGSNVAGSPKRSSSGGSGGGRTGAGRFSRDGGQQVRCVSLQLCACTDCVVAWPC
jgi:hypothetical protein